MPMYHVPLRRRKEREKVSEVWKTFFINPHEPNSVICRLCGTSLSYVGGSTSGMRNHLQNKHRQRIRNEDGSSSHHQNSSSPTVLTPKYREVLSPPTYTSESSRQLDAQQLFNGSSVGSPSDVGTSSRKVTKELAIMCATDLLPLDVVNGRGFRWFVHLLDPVCNLPGVQEVRTAAADLCKTLKLKLRLGLHQKPCSLSLETWWGSTATASQCQCNRYLTVTVHFITDSWENSSRVLGTLVLPEEDNSSSAQGLAEDIRQLMEEYSVVDSQIVAVLHAPSPVLDQSMKILNWPVIQCGAHMFNTCLNEAIIGTSTAGLLSSGLKLLNSINDGELKQKILEQTGIDSVKNIASLNLQGAKFKWKSILVLFQNIYEHKTLVLREMEATNGPDIEYLRGQLWEDIKCLLPVLQRLDIAAEALTIDNYQPLSCMLPIVFSLLDGYLQDWVEETDTIKETKQSIRNQLEKSLNIRDPSLGQSLFALSSVVDPRHKALLFLALNQRIKTQEALQEIVRGYLYRDTLRSPHRGSSTAATETSSHEGRKRRDSSLCNGETGNKKSKMEMLLEGMFGYSTEEYTGEDGNDPMVELVQYFGEPVAPLAQEPVLWWKAREAKYPCLSQVARKYLCVPATAVSHELAFTDGSDVTTRLRLALHPDHMHDLVFLHTNLTPSDLEEMGFEVEGHTDEMMNSDTCDFPEAVKTEPSFLLNYEKDS